MKHFKLFTVMLVLALLLPTFSTQAAMAASPTYDITTLAGKVASVNGTAGLQIRFSAFIEQEAEMEQLAPVPSTPITPAFVLSSPLDGTSVLAPNVTVNQDTAGAPQNETAIVVDPNNPNRVVAGANDYVTRSWACDINGTPCSALGDGYSGTYFSNDGGQTWSGVSSDPSHLGTLIPGVTRLTGGIYDAGGDPSLAFDSQGNVFYAGLGFDRTAPPNTVAVNKGTFDSGGQLTWGPPTFINPTTAPSTLNDKEWIAADWHVSSPFRDRVYVSWTRFIFNPHNGSYVQSPIFFAYSTDGGATFSDPQNISGNVLYDQGSRPFVAYDGTVYVVWEGSTRLATLDSTYIAKSTDGGVTFSKPVAISTLQAVIPPANTAFRNDSFPAADAAPNGDLYVAWSTQMSRQWWICALHERIMAAISLQCTASRRMVEPPGVRLHRFSPHWMPQPAQRLVIQPLMACKPQQHAVWIPSGQQWQSHSLAAYTCRLMQRMWSHPGRPVRVAQLPPVGRITCDTLGAYIHNARLDYYVADLTTGCEPEGFNPSHQHPQWFWWWLHR